MSDGLPTFLIPPLTPTQQAVLKEAAIAYCYDKKLDPFERVYSEMGGHEWQEERWVHISTELADLEVRLSALYWAKRKLDN